MSVLYIYYKPYGTKIRYTLWSQGMKSWIFISVWLKFNIDGEPPLSFYFSFSSEKSLSWLASVMQVDMVFGISRKTFFLFSSNCLLVKTFHSFYRISREKDVKLITKLDVDFGWSTSVSIPFPTRSLLYVSLHIQDMMNSILWALRPDVPIHYKMCIYYLFVTHIFNI